MDSEHHDVVDMLKYVVGYTIAVEALATVIMGSYLQWFADPALIGGQNPWWWALSHSVSAFNNAGFGLNQNNLANFPTDPVINLTISALIIIGGLGYPVLIAMQLFVRKRFNYHLSKQEKASIEHNLSGVASLVQIRVALIGTIVLLVLEALSSPL